MAAVAGSKEANIDDATAVAGSKDSNFDDAAAVAGTKEANIDDAWVWGPPGDQTMHPFWAVRRLTQKQLTREVAFEQKLLRFNCRLGGSDSVLRHHWSGEITIAEYHEVV